MNSQCALLCQAHPLPANLQGRPSHILLRRSESAPERQIITSLRHFLLPSLMFLFSGLLVHP